MQVSAGRGPSAGRTPAKALDRRVWCVKRGQRVWSRGNKVREWRGPLGIFNDLGFLPAQGWEPVERTMVVSTQDSPWWSQVLYFFPFAGPILWNQGWPGPPNWWCVHCKTWFPPGSAGHSLQEAGRHIRRTLEQPVQRLVPLERNQLDFFFFSNFILILLLEFGKKPCDCTKLIL